MSNEGTKTRNSKMVAGPRLLPQMILLDSETSYERRVKLVCWAHAHFPGSQIVVMDVDQPVESLAESGNGEISHSTSDFIKYRLHRAQVGILTAREQEVMNLVSLGGSNLQIASTLGLSIYTVKSHIHNILSKLALRTRVELARHVLIAQHSTR